MENTKFVQQLVVVTVNDSRHDEIETKVIMRDKIKDFVSEMVATYGTGITMYQNKAYISSCGSIESGEYLGSIDLESCGLERIL